MKPWGLYGYYGSKKEADTKKMELVRKGIPSSTKYIFMTHRYAVYTKEK